MAELRRVARDASASSGTADLLGALKQVESHLESWVTGLRAEISSLQTKLLQSNELAMTDGLTRLGNRLAFDERLAVLWEAARRDERPLGLLIVDIDHFKEFNDLDGHVAGDECLKKVAAAIKDAVDRPNDVVCRYGGDEFGVIVPATDELGVRSIAETIRERVARTHFTERGAKVERCVTVSIGAAALVPLVGQLPQNLIAAADAGLYDAKARGRNTVALNPRLESPVEPAPTVGLLHVQRTRFKVVGGALVLGPDVVEARAAGKPFTGAILSVDGGRVVQNMGRGVAVVHDAARLDRVPAVAETVCIMYDKERGNVVELLRSLDRAPGRD